MTSVFLSKHTERTFLETFDSFYLFRPCLRKPKEDLSEHEQRNLQEFRKQLYEESTIFEAVNLRTDLEVLSTYDLRDLLDDKLCKKNAAAPLENIKVVEGSVPLLFDWDIEHPEMWENRLASLEEAARNGWDRLKESCRSLLDDMKPLPKQRFDIRLTHHVECLTSKKLLEHYSQSKKDMEGKIPVKTRADGNCFFDSLSLLKYGDHAHDTEMRVRLVVQGVSQKRLYLDTDRLMNAFKEDSPYTTVGNLYEVLAKDGPHASELLRDQKSEETLEEWVTNPKNLKAAYKAEMMAMARDQDYVGLFAFFLAADCLSERIRSLEVAVQVPKKGFPLQHNQTYNLEIEPTLPNPEGDENPLVIMWTMVDNKVAEFNHFVPLVR